VGSFLFSQLNDATSTQLVILVETSSSSKSSRSLFVIVEKIGPNGGELGFGTFSFCRAGRRELLNINAFPPRAITVDRSDLRRRRGEE
jgi:hypothetical protein